MESDNRSQFLFFRIIALAILGSVLTLAAVLYLYQEENEILEETRVRLAASGEFKEHQVATWREGLLDATTKFADNARLQSIVKDFILHPTPGDRLRLGAWLDQLYRLKVLSGIELFDASGKVLFAFNGVDVGPRTSVPAAPTFSGPFFSRTSPDAVEFEVCIPLRNDPTALPYGTMLCRVDPAQELFPLLQWDPGREVTVESALMVRQDSMVAAISEFRHDKNSPLRWRRPISTPNLPAAMAARGERGIVEGVDYRGQRVMADVRVVRGTEWLLLTKIDLEEALKPMFVQRWIAAGIAIAMFLVVSNVLGLAWIIQDRGQRKLLERYERKGKILAAHYAVLTKNANDSILLFWDSGQILDVNDRAVESYGYSREELLLMNVTDVRSPEARPFIEGQLQQAYTSGGAVFETTHMRRDGTSFPVEVSARAILLDGGRVMQCHIRDISERKASENRIRVLTRLHHLHSAVNQLIIREEKLQSLVARASQIAVDEGEFMFAWIGRYDEAQGLIHPEAVYGKSGSLPDLKTIDVHDEGQSLGPVVRALRTQSSVIKNDLVPSEPINAPWRERSYRTGIQAIAAFPLIVDGAMWGVLSLYVGHAGFFDSDEVNLLEEVAADIAFAIGVIAVRDRGKKLALLHEELESERSLLLKRLELQFDSMPVGCIVSDPALRVMQWNGAAERIFGYKEKEAVGRDMIEYIAHESIRQSLQRRVRQVLSERRPFVTIGEGITKSGTRVLCRWTVVPLRSDAGVDVGTMAMAEDVSDKFAMEQALERETGKLRRAQELARVGDWTWNLQTSHLSCSDELCAMVGVPQAKNGENLARAYLRNVRPEDVRRLLMANARAVSHGKVAPLQFRIIRPDGSERVLWVEHDKLVRDKDGRPSLMTGIAQDITERAIAEQQLVLKDRALEAAANGIVITDATGHISWVNQAFTKLTGYSAEDVIGRTPALMKSGRQSEEFYGELWRTILSGHSWMGQLVNRRKDGSLYTEEMTITPVRNSDGAVTHYVAIKQDITERLSLQRELSQAQKMEGLGTLAGGIAHDFNNILGIILAHTSLFPIMSSDPVKQDQSIAAITKAVQRGSSLVRQILLFARKTEAAIHPEPVNEIIRELRRMLVETFPKTILIEERLTEELPPVAADRTQIHQVLLNLCVNARDAMEEGGTLTISTKMVEELEVRMRFHEASGAYVRVDVCDTGSGIDAEIVSRIFEPFFTTKGPGKGTGLGLSLVYSIVQGHKGFVDVESAPGIGTQFHVYLPVQSASMVQRSEEDGVDAAILGGSERVLLVEDEDLLRAVMANALRQHGYSVLEASDGEEALEVFGESGKDIDLVLSDIGLPKLSGIELFRRLKERSPGLVEILATGYIEPEDRSRLLGEGVKAFIEKPYEISKVLSAVRSILDFEARTEKVPQSM